MTTQSIEQERDTRQAAADQARERWQEAQTACSEAEQALDGTDGAAKKWEAAKRLLERRQVELKNLEQRFQLAEAAIEEARLAQLRKEYSKLRDETDLSAARLAVDAVAQRAAAHAAALQEALQTARDIAHAQAAKVRRLKEIAPEIGELGIAPAMERAEAEAVLGQRLAVHAGTRLERIPLEEGEVLDRELRANEMLVPMPIEEVQAARVRKMTWRGISEFFRQKGS